MKKFHLKKTSLFLLMMMLSISFSVEAQKKKSGNIMTSTSIEEVTEFLKNAHPDDTRVPLLRSRLIALKNAEMMKRAREAKPMAARPLETETPAPKNMAKPSEDDEKKALAKKEEEEEFNKLMAETSAEHKEKTLKLLNTLFDQDISSSEMVLLIQNNSDCNMILRIQGNKYYNLAVPTHGENSIVLEKGQYSFTSNVCDTEYVSTKYLDKSQIVVLSNPTLKTNLDSALANNSSDKVIEETVVTSKKGKGPSKKKQQ